MTPQSSTPPNAVHVHDVLQIFEDTYESIQAENGYGLGPDALADAQRQVVLYWLKLQEEVAKRITETEVPLTLMNQVTPSGTKYSIHGVVDVVEDRDQVILYDIKSHNFESIHEDRERFAPQLEVYAHIWAQLRGKPVHQTCIIATDPPRQVKRIQSVTDMSPTERQHFDAWQPVVNIDFHQNRMQETIAHFGEIIDLIEARRFTPPTPARLQQMWHDRGEKMICAKCDARFSCDAYRAFAASLQGGHTAQLMHLFVDSGLTQGEHEELLDRAMYNADEAE
jgi:hypothetical protein